MRTGYEGREEVWGAFRPGEQANNTPSDHLAPHSLAFVRRHLIPQGHVDTTALIRSVVPNGNALTFTLRLSHSPDVLPTPSSLSPYLIPKGYVTLDGASLTLIDVSPPQGGKIQGTAGELREEVGGEQDTREVVEFSVMLIKHTQDVIGLSKKMPGELVNVELDVSGPRYHANK